MSVRKAIAKRRVRGIVISTEMILLLTAVIMFAIIAFFGISKAVLSQATSQKQTLVVVRAEGWKVGDAVAVSLYVHNTGSQTVHISQVGIKYTRWGTVYDCHVNEGVDVHPGETKVISAAIGQSSGSGSCYYVRYIGNGQPIFTYVKVGNQLIGTAVRVTSP